MLCVVCCLFGLGFVWLCVLLFLFVGIGCLVCEVFVLGLFGFGRVFWYRCCFWFGVFCFFGVGVVGLGLFVFWSFGVWLLFFGVVLC